MTLSVPYPARWLLFAVATTLAIGLGGFAISAPSNARSSSQPFGGYSWPVKPFDQAHPVRANLGDPRTVFRGTSRASGLAGSGSFSFHNGIDIDAPTGTRVYPVVSGLVISVVGRTGVVVQPPDGRLFHYWHIIPTVHPGQEVTARETILGHVRNWAEELHFAEFSAGHQAVDPLLPGHLTPYRDTTPPVVAEVEIRDLSGNRLAPFDVHGRISLVAEAYDPPVPVPTRARRMFSVSRYEQDRFPVTPVVVTWSLSSRKGRVVVPQTVAVDFRDGIGENSTFWSVYARGTYQNRSAIGKRMHEFLPGRFLFKLAASSLDTRRLADGVYIVTVTAIDVSGNRSSLRERFEVWNGGRPR